VISPNGGEVIVGAAHDTGCHPLVPAGYSSLRAGVSVGS
jgi:hypothetical protein